MNKLLATSDTISGCKLIKNETDNKFPEVFFDSAVKLTKGQYYHFVFRNLDPDPRNNYVSINTLAAGGNGQPEGKDSVLWKATQKHSWANQTSGRGDTPIYEIQYADQQVQGSYITEVWVKSPQYIFNNKNQAQHVINTEGLFAKVRQVFTYKNDKYTNLFDGVKVRLATRGYKKNPDDEVNTVFKKTGQLKVQLLDATGNELRYAYLPEGIMKTPTWVNLKWAKCKSGAVSSSCRAGSIFSPVSLTENAEYSVVLSMPVPHAENGQFIIYPLKDGTDINRFDHRLSDFKSGQAEYLQYRNGGNWQGWDVVGYPTPRADAVLQLYLTRP